MSYSKPAGWLLLRPKGLISDRLALAFLGQQARSHWMILDLGLLIAVLASVIFERQKLAPLRRTQGSNEAMRSQWAVDDSHELRRS